MAKFGNGKKKFNYYDAFERQAEIAVKEAELLLEVVEKFDKAEGVQVYLPRAHALENEGDEICHGIYDAILPDFVTPIDREDIVALANNLDELIDVIEEIIQAFYIYDVHFMHNDVKPIATLLHRACCALKDAMGVFHKCKKSDKFRSLVILVNELEDEVDELYLKAIRKLYTVDRDNPMRAAVWTNIFDSMETCADQCERIANMMGSIMLKNG